MRRQAPAGRPQLASPRPSRLESASPHRRLEKPLHGNGPSASVPSGPGKRTLHLGLDDDRRPEGRRPAVRSRARRNAHISEHRCRRYVRRPGASPASRGTRSRASRERGVAACTRTVASAKGAIGFRPRTRCATLSPECGPDSSCPAGCGVGVVGQLVRCPGGRAAREPVRLGSSNASVECGVLHDNCHLDFCSTLGDTDAVVPVTSSV